jgi:CheY-like chemotaxis protein
LQTDLLRNLQDEFLASLNHEIRTPLSGILGMTDLLLETPLSDDQREYASAARLCAENLLELLNVTLEYSALSANHVRLEESEFPVGETLRGVLNEFAAKAEAKGLCLDAKLDKSLPATAIGDPLRVRQILWHLLANAVKFTREGNVEISASLTAATNSGPCTIVIAVRDTGIGIPLERLNQIFDSFCQLETGLARSHGGLGLGLAVVQKLVQLLKGKIHVTSEYGKGSVFTVQLPLRTASVAPRLESLSKSRGRVLVIDDNNVAQTIASHALRRQSFEVQCAADGPQAFDAASKSRFDVILIDLQMPGWDGFETAGRIRELPGYREIPMIAVTANCSDDYRARCVSCGMQDFLPKPVRTRDLVQTVEKYLAREAVAG